MTTRITHHAITPLDANISIYRDKGRGDPCNRGDEYTINVIGAPITVKLVFNNEEHAEEGGPWPNGLTDEALLAVVQDRLECFQVAHATKSREYALAITKIEEALHWLGAHHKRIATEKR